MKRKSNLSNIKQETKNIKIQEMIQNVSSQDMIIFLLRNIRIDEML